MTMTIPIHSTPAQHAQAQGLLAGIDRLIWRAVDGLLFVVVAALLFSVSCQAASRLFGFGAPWTEELARLLFIWTAFLGMATGFHSRSHPRIFLLSAMLPRSLRSLPHYLSAVASILLFSIVGWYAVDMLMQRLAFGETSPVLGIGMWLATAPVVLGSALAAIGSLMSLPRDLADERAALAILDRKYATETNQDPETRGREHRT
ncbi:TRAP transporter small permease [Arenibaculum pallidiluteum]|uniref:TRAP transporter small permease n=1 Tax=Arenibaculum pallidiluteum TaxID=2812559 RepID=UPI001A9581B9|nr:TRAP transporter small permease subunit [Arenibaculum pallidiluteum]